MSDRDRWEKEREDVEASLERVRAEHQELEADLTELYEKLETSDRESSS